MIGSYPGVMSHCYPQRENSCGDHIERSQLNIYTRSPIIICKTLHTPPPPRANAELLPEFRITVTASAESRTAMHSELGTRRKYRPEVFAEFRGVLVACGGPCHVLGPRGRHDGLKKHWAMR
jgi:hypothetical protein